MSSKIKITITRDGLSPMKKIIECEDEEELEERSAYILENSGDDLIRYLEKNDYEIVSSDEDGYIDSYECLRDPDGCIEGWSASELLEQISGDRDYRYSIDRE